MAKDIYLQPNAPDPIHSNEVVLDIVRKYVPDVKAVTKVDESGGEARTYAVDDHIILKVQRPQQLRPRTSLEKEVFFLNQLALDKHIQVPKVLGYGRDHDIEYTVMTRIPGIAIVNTTLSSNSRKETLYTLGQTLRSIHSMSQEPFIESNQFPGDSNFEEVKSRFEESFQGIITRIYDKQVRWSLKFTPEQVVEKALSKLPHSRERVALHSNPGPTHTFVDSSTGRFSGLIDFGDAYISHPAWDLWRWNLPEDRQAVLNGYTSSYPVDDLFLDTWTVVMVLSDMMAIAYQMHSNVESEEDLNILVKQM